MADDMYDLDDFINPFTGEGDKSADTNYWRGLAIIVATDVTVGADKEKDAKSFILWASKQPDINRIISVVKERDTLNVLTVQGVIEEQSKTTAPLREGTL
jgi:hypothetical protein